MFLCCNPIHASDAPMRHSLESDYSFMIGRWTCHVTQAGTPDRDVSVEYEWAYDKHVLRESMRVGDKVIGEFLTTYDKATDKFKGVGVGAWSYVVWENSGFHEGHLSERGFVFDGGKMTPVSRSEFDRISDTHTWFTTLTWVPLQAPGPRPTLRTASSASDCDLRWGRALVNRHSRSSATSRSGGGGQTVLRGPYIAAGRTRRPLKDGLPSHMTEPHSAPPWIACLLSGA
jgi:hypothetical protein